MKMRCGADILSGGTVADLECESQTPGYLYRLALPVVRPREPTADRQWRAERRARANPLIRAVVVPGSSAVFSGFRVAEPRLRPGRGIEADRQDTWSAARIRTCVAAIRALQSIRRPLLHQARHRGGSRRKYEFGTILPGVVLQANEKQDVTAESENLHELQCRGDCPATGLQSRCTSPPKSSSRWKETCVSSISGPGQNVHSSPASSDFAAEEAQTMAVADPGFDIAEWPLNTISPRFTMHLRFPGGTGKIVEPDTRPSQIRKDFLPDQCTPPEISVAG